MNPETCPNCSSTAIFPGRFVGEGAGVFAPIGLRPLRAQTGVGIAWQEGRACLACGHAWTRLAPDDLRALIMSSGKELAKQRLAALDPSTYPVPPDPPGSEEAAQKVAEIDALVLEERLPAATRRFRELSGMKWDDAIRVVPKWADLTRPEKLALFGCIVKDPARRGHPMHDALLDG